MLVRFQKFLALNTKCLFFLLLLLWSAVVRSSVDHPFHVSTCDVIYKEKEKSLQISYHIFLDDLEVALKSQSAEKLYLATPKESRSAESVIVQYLKGKFKVSVNNKPQQLVFVGKEYASDKLAVWCYFEITELSEISEISIENTVLLETFSDQKNIVHLVGPSGKKGHFLHQKGREVEHIKF
jgi:hypothetical protein